MHSTALFPIAAHAKFALNELHNISKTLEHNGHTSASMSALHKSIKAEHKNPLKLTLITMLHGTKASNRMSTVAAPKSLAVDNDGVLKAVMVLSIDDDFDVSRFSLEKATQDVHESLNTLTSFFKNIDSFEGFMAPQAWQFNANRFTKIICEYYEHLFEFYKELESSPNNKAAGEISYWRTLFFGDKKTIAKKKILKNLESQLDHIKAYLECIKAMFEKAKLGFQR